MTTYPAPSGRTARRLEWPFLPPNLRAYDRAQVRVARGGRRVAGRRLHPGLRLRADLRGRLAALREGGLGEGAADVRRVLPRGGAQAGRAARSPCPRRGCCGCWTTTGWCSGMEYVDGANPARPWRQADLDACLDALRGGRRRARPRRRTGWALDTIADEFADMAGFWDHVRATQPGLPHLEEAAALAGRFAEVAAGDTVVHTDVRDDNFLIGADGKVWMCDWNWPVLGAAWLDSLFMLIGPRGDGLDVEPVIAARPLLRDVPRRAHRHHAGAAGRATSSGSATSRCPRPPRTSATTSRGRARSAGPGCASAGAGDR